jgi:hypothetical protein
MLPGLLVLEVIAPEIDIVRAIRTLGRRRDTRWCRPLER